MKKLLLALMLFALPSFADNRGVSNLGLCHRNFTYDAIRQQFKHASVIRTKYLDNTFNPRGCGNLTLLLQETKPLDLTTVILNGPGLRNNRLEKHEIHYGYSISALDKAIRSRNEKFLSKFRSRLTLNAGHLNTRSGITVHRVNPCLECDLSPAARKILIEETRKVFPNSIIIDNPYNQPCIPGLVCEKHGSAANPPRPKIVDLDGEDYDSILPFSWASRHLNAEAVFAWKFCNNGLDRKQPWRPPTQRNAFCGQRDNLDLQYFVRADALNTNPRPTPNPNKCARQRADWRGWPVASDGVRAGFTWKLGDGKHYAIALFPRNVSRFNRVEIRKDGATLDTAKYRGKYTYDGSNRLIYDFSKHVTAYPNAVDLWADSTCWHLAKPQFRAD